MQKIVAALAVLMMGVAGLWILIVVIVGFAAGLLSGFVTDPENIGWLTWPASMSDLVRGALVAVAATPGVGLFLLGQKILALAGQAACEHRFVSYSGDQEWCPKCDKLRRKR